MSYVLRISDWSLNVCSSDLGLVVVRRAVAARHGTLLQSVARVWKIVDGTDTRWPARHRYRGPCTALEPGKGRGLAGREYAVEPCRQYHRDPALHRHAGTGLRL